MRLKLIFCSKELRQIKQHKSPLCFQVFYLIMQIIFLLQDNLKSDKMLYIIYTENLKCLKASQIENRINYLEKKEIDIDCLKENEKEFIKIG